MKNLAQFNAVYCSGIFIPEPAMTTALSLLFNKVYLPNNMELVLEVAKKYNIRPPYTKKSKGNGKIELNEVGGNSDPFVGMTEKQKRSALSYLEWGFYFCGMNHDLFGEVFETNLYPGGKILDVKLIRKGVKGNKNLYSVSQKPMYLEGENEKLFPRLVSNGYVPVVGNIHSNHLLSRKFDKHTTKELAALLAMKSMEMIFPRTKEARSEEILEARHKLSDHLPPYWSSMLKLSVELKKRIKECKTPLEVVLEGQEIVDSTVRPALIDLRSKLEKERKDWFYKILSPVQKGLRLLIGNPPLTQQQLISSALVLGSDVLMSSAENMRLIDNMKSESGLTFLIEMDKILNK